MHIHEVQHIPEDYVYATSLGHYDFYRDADCTTFIVRTPGRLLYLDPMGEPWEDYADLFTLVEGGQLTGKEDE